MLGSYKKQIDKYFLGQMSNIGERDALFRALEHRPQDRAYFEQLFQAERNLAGAEQMVPSELNAVGTSIIEEFAAKRAPSWRAHLGLGVVFAPVAAIILLFWATPMLAPRTAETEFTARGTAEIFAPTLEVLCFDSNAEVIAHQKQSGACPAPGFIKLLYASAKTTEHLTVAVVSEEKLVFVERLSAPKPRSIVPRHANLEPGQSLAIIVATDEIDLQSLLKQKPLMVISGAAQ